MKQTLTSLFSIVFFVLMGVSAVQAQECEYIYDIKYNVAGDTLRKPLYYGHYTDYKKAARIYRELGSKGYVDADDVSKYALERSSDGHFEFIGFDKMGVILIDEDQRVYLIEHRDGKITNQLIHYYGYENSSQTVTMVEEDNWYLNSKKIGENRCLYSISVNSKQLRNVDVNNNSGPGGNDNDNTDYGDGYQRMTVHLELPAGMHEHASRITIFPYAVDCQTDTIMDYLPPSVWEGVQYHELQNKRKGFNYEKNDGLGGNRTYTKYVSWDDTVRIDTVWTREYELGPDKKPIYIGEDSMGNAIAKFKMVPKIEYVIERRDSSYIVHAMGYKHTIHALKHDSLYNLIYIDTTFVYKKPNKNRTYRALVKYSMEDYHHQYKFGVDEGTCMVKTPFKFLQLSTGGETMALAKDFKENPGERLDEGGKDNLGMNFEYNSDKLIYDSVYRASIDEIENDMTDIVSSEGRLLNPVLEAYASPDGREDYNLNLARRRGKTAADSIRIPNGITITIKPVIDTWEHTADLLDEAGHAEEAQVLREIISPKMSKQAIGLALQGKLGKQRYMEIVRPALDKQCRIKFTYKYSMERQLSAAEAVQRYYKNKDAVYSNGEYWNMFSLIKDSAELDTLTSKAYARVVVTNKQYDRPFAAYVANQMAVLKIKQMQPDTMMLKPFMNERGRTLIINQSVSDGIVRYTTNRPEIVLNQAIMFYMAQEPGRAKWIIGQLNNQYDSPLLRRMKAFVDFKQTYAKPASRRTDQDKKELARAINYLEQDPVARAVLYTEFTDLKKRDEAWSWVHKMDDNNPLKWYLFGILWSTKDGQESDYPLIKLTPRRKNPLMTEEEKNELQLSDPQRWADQMEIEKDYLSEHPDAKPDTVYMENVKDDSDVDISGIPYYMAYFQKSFDLNKEFMRYYFTEGHIPEKKRQAKGHAYKLDRVPAYRKIFRLRKPYDDLEREKILSKEKLDALIDKKQEMKSGVRDEEDTKDAQETKQSDNDGYETLNK